MIRSLSGRAFLPVCPPRVEGSANHWRVRAGPFSRRLGCYPILRVCGQANPSFWNEGSDMKDRKVTSDMVAIIKLARMRRFNYARIAAYFQINQGRIADVMKGRIGPDIPPAMDLPPDFPEAA